MFTKAEKKTISEIQSLRKKESTPSTRAKIRHLKNKILFYRAKLRAAGRKSKWTKERRFRYTALLAVYKADPVPHTAEAIEKDIGLLALASAHKMVGKVEVGYNDAPWLRQMENDLPHNRLDWMIPGQSYCGFGCIWSYWDGAKVLLPDGTVYTPNICPYGGHYLGDLKFTRVEPENAKPGALVVMNFGAGGAKHVALARRPMRRGTIDTREFNTSPGSGGNQGNGGGVWDRNRPKGYILCVLNVSRA